MRKIENSWEKAKEYYLDLTTENKTFHINSAPVREPNELCNSLTIDHIGDLGGGRVVNSNPNASYVSYQLGKGMQGAVYAIRKRRKIISVMKVAENLDVLLFEANALYAKQHHPIELLPDYTLLGLSTADGSQKEWEYNLDHDNKLIVKSKKTNYCLFTNYVRGSQLVKETDFPFLAENLVQFLIFFITLLRQIQAIHFTVNHYPYTEEDIFLRGVANAHADIYSSNIIIVQSYFGQGDSVEERQLPMLIDYGLGMKNYYLTDNDFISEIFNNYLREENKIKKENVISKNRIYNQWQNIDFCEILILIGKTIMPIDGTVIHRSCQEFRQNLKTSNIDGYYHNQIHLFRALPYELRSIKPLLLILLEGARETQTYLHWIEMVRLLSPHHKMKTKSNLFNLLTTTDIIEPKEKTQTKVLQSDTECKEKLENEGSTTVAPRKNRLKFWRRLNCFKNKQD
ncbi:hypothetical protein SNEBB_008298 [Seison nebaliae]|nr:hypothetical protein SNEBB_008298 [Seison nebaliae]